MSSRGGSGWTVFLVVVGCVMYLEVNVIAWFGRMFVPVVMLASIVVALIGARRLLASPGELVRQLWEFIKASPRVLLQAGLLTAFVAYPIKVGLIAYPGAYLWEMSIVDSQHVVIAAFSVIGFLLFIFRAKKSYAKAYETDAKGLFIRTAVFWVLSMALLTGVWKIALENVPDISRRPVPVAEQNKWEISRIKQAKEQIQAAEDYKKRVLTVEIPKRQSIINNGEPGATTAAADIKFYEDNLKHNEQEAKKLRLVIEVHQEGMAAREAEEARRIKIPNLRDLPWSIVLALTFAIAVVWLFAMRLAATSAQAAAAARELRAGIKTMLATHGIAITVKNQKATATDASMSAELEAAAEKQGVHPSVVISHFSSHANIWLWFAWFIAMVPGAVVNCLDAFIDLASQTMLQKYYPAVPAKRNPLAHIIRGTVVG